MAFVALGWVEHVAHAGNWNAEVREIQRFLLNIEKRIKYKLRVKSRNGSINRCVVKTLLTERKVGVSLILVFYIFYQKQPRIWRFPDGETVTYVCDNVRANQAPNQVLSSEIHSKSCSTNCTQTTYSHTSALGTTKTVQFCSSGAAVPKGTTAVILWLAQFLTRRPFIHGLWDLICCFRGQGRHDVAVCAPQ
jgi:hypothetical protein